METGIRLTAVCRKYFFLQVSVHNYDDIVPVSNVQYIYVVVRGGT